MEYGAVAGAADVTLALGAESRTAAVATEIPTANRTGHEVPRPHSVGPVKEENTPGTQKSTNSISMVTNGSDRKMWEKKAKRDVVGIRIKHGAKFRRFEMKTTRM